MDKVTRNKLISQYKDGYRVVAEALAGATAEELDARPAPGKWTAREIVHHLADSEMTSAIRLRLLLAQDRPEIRGYDEEWKREGTHSEHGRYTIERWLEIYAVHGHNHAGQIRVARDAARKNRRE